MYKANKEHSYLEYDLTPVFGTDVIQPAAYAQTANNKNIRRNYGNFVLLESKKSNDHFTDKVFHSQEHLSADYLISLQSVSYYVGREFSRRNCRENLWKRAVENLYKRISFLELNIEYLQEDISEEQFEQVLTEHEAEYVVVFRDMRDTLEAEAIYDIVRALDRSFEVHEVAELFGVKPEHLYQLRDNRDEQLPPHLYLYNH